MYNLHRVLRAIRKVMIFWLFFRGKIVRLNGYQRKGANPSVLWYLQQVYVLWERFGDESTLERFCTILVAICSFRTSVLESKNSRTIFPTGVLSYWSISKLRAWILFNWWQEVVVQTPLSYFPPKWTLCFYCVSMQVLP